MRSNTALRTAAHCFFVCSRNVAALTPCETPYKDTHVTQILRFSAMNVIDGKISFCKQRIFFPSYYFIWVRRDIYYKLVANFPRKMKRNESYI